MAYTAYSDLPSIVQSSKLERWGIPITPTATRDAEILKHANRAASVIHTYLARRFGSSLPFDDPPQAIKDISLDLTIYFMASVQPVKGETYQEIYDNSILLLKMLSEGKLDLFDSVGESKLAEYDYTYGMETDTDYAYDEEEDDYRVFPRSLMSAPPSSYERTYREEE